MKRGADLLDPENVFKAINHAKRFDHKTRKILDQEWSNGSKNNAAQAYKSFCNINDINILKHINFDKWSRHPQKIHWIPLESEIDQLIAGCSQKVAALCSYLKKLE